jgi:hypothetical protein
MATLALPPSWEAPVQFLVITFTVLLIPVVLMLCLVLYRVVVLLTQSSELVQLTQYELMPLIRDARVMVTNFSQVSGRVNQGVNAFSSGVEKLSPAVRQGAETLKNTLKDRSCRVQEAIRNWQAKRRTST